VARIADRLRDGTFCLTYADGIADIDLSAQRDFHEREDALATTTVVRPYSQWGIAMIDDRERITGCQEKPRLDYWINGGFFCIEPGFLDYLEKTSVLERDPMERVAAEGRWLRFATRLLGLHGHLQGRSHARGPVGPVATLGARGGRRGLVATALVGSTPSCAPPPRPVGAPQSAARTASAASPKLS
jgi:hypothetical protein